MLIGVLMKCAFLSSRSLRIQTGLKRIHHVRLVYTKIIMTVSISWYFIGKKFCNQVLHTSLIFFPGIAVPIIARIERDGETGQSLRRAETHVRILRNFGATSSDDNYGKIVIYVRTALAPYGGKRRVPDSRYFSQQNRPCSPMLIRYGIS